MTEPVDPSVIHMRRLLACLNAAIVDLFDLRHAVIKAMGDDSYVISPTETERIVQRLKRRYGEIK